MFEVNNTDSIMTANPFQLNTSRAGVNPFASIDDMLNGTGAEKIENPFTQPAELIEAFELDDPKNMYKIINLFPISEMKELIPLLSDESLCLGMKLYEKEKIMNFLFDTTQNDIAKVLTKIMPEEKIFELIPEKFLNKFLINEDIDKKDFTKALARFEPKELKELMESLFGMPQNNKTPEQMIKLLDKIPKEKLQPMFLTLKPKHKTKLVANMMKENEELYELFNKSHLLLPLEQQDKKTTLKGLSALEPEQLTNMLEELPEELLPVLLTMIDPEIFAQLLIEKYPEIIIQVLKGDANISQQSMRS